MERALQASPASLHERQCGGALRPAPGRPHAIAAALCTDHGALGADLQAQGGCQAPGRSAGVALGSLPSPALSRTVDTADWSSGVSAPLQNPRPLAASGGGGACCLSAPRA